MTLPDRLRWLRVSSLWAYRILTAFVLAIGLTFAGMVLGLRYWVLPKVESYREDIARIVTERARQKVTIGSISANWDGLRPQLVLEQVTVYDTAGRPALELARIDNTLSWMSVLARELRFYALDIYRPTLNIRRDERGTVSIGGMEVAAGEDGGGGGGGFAEWLLRQRDVEIHEATIVWNDEQRKAPQLELKNVSLQLFNRGGRHRFGLRATPPRDLAAPLDLRGDIKGESLRSLNDWTGELFLRLDYVDIAAWRTWFPFPVHFPRGAGALRAWLTFSRDQLVDAVADVRLASVLTRLGEDLPQLDLTELSGRVGWKQSGGDFEVSTSQLRLTTRDGIKVPPTDFLLRIVSGDQRRPGRGELRASIIQLGPLATLADHLPLGKQTRSQLAEYSPRGVLNDVVLNWIGEWHEPKEYNIRGRFQNVALNHMGRIPGFKGITGTIEATERRGSLTLNSRKAAVEMPLVFRDAHEFDTLGAQVSWTRGGRETELRLNSISFSNAHLAGTVIGTYRTSGTTAGSIDLTGNLTRADARYVGRYIPLAVPKSARDWLDAAFIAGESNNVTLRLKGALDEFPFQDSRTGFFQVAARVTGGVLHYAEGWPRITNIAGDLIFRGERMDVYARQGSLSGTRLARVHAEIPNLMGGGRVLNVNGEAEGQTADFLRFIDASPVAGMIDRFTEGWQAQGAGRLALKLSIPLADTAKSKVAGSYQFTGNSVTLASALPAIEQTSGRVDFTETGVRVQGIRGTFLGGPLSISAASAGDATVRLNVQGRINADAARRGAAPAWAQRLRGATDWRAQFVTRKRSADVMIESSLQGLAVDLPAPLVKTGAESLPVRFERRLLGEKEDRISFSAGGIVSMILLRRLDGENATIARGTVRFGGAAAEPARNGLWVTGAVKALDLDHWLAVFQQADGGAPLEAGGVDLRLGTVDMLGRRFNELAVNANVQRGQWRVALKGRELDGAVTWLPQGAGRLTARMSMLAVPAASPTAGEPASDDAQARKEQRKPPELDIVAEQFINKGRPLGRLEVAAVPEENAWRIDRLRLSNPESTFTVDGSWQFGAARPRTQVNVHVETSDIGALLARFGYPEGVKGGTAKLEGSLAWTGAPYEFDVPSLTGNFAMEAAKGQFVQLDPGIGKLLGVMSLQALPRRMSLDFKDVFSEGFAFDEIAGTVQFNRGTATTDNLRIRGPAAHILMRGDVDLGHETQNLRVRITPHVIETVSVAGALVGGPIAGVAAYLAQQVLKDPFGKLVTYEYDVSGSWSDPVVKRLARPLAVPEAEGKFE
jgi:uncharacterized protein (TIGR02099 family)